MLLTKLCAFAMVEAVQGVDPFIVHMLEVQYGNRKPSKYAEIAVRSLDCATCPEQAFTTLVEEGVDAILKALPPAVKPSSSGPRRLLSFDVQTLDGEWKTFREADIVATVWKADFLRRRTVPCKFRYVHQVQKDDGQISYRVYTRRVSAKSKKSGSASKSAVQEEAWSLVAQTSEDVNRIKTDIHKVCSAELCSAS